MKYTFSTVFNSSKLEITQISTNSRMDVLWYIHTMEYRIGVSMSKLQLHTTMNEPYKYVEKQRQQKVVHFSF